MQQQHDFETTLLNAKMAELQKEIDRYQKENAALSSGRRKLQHDRKQLAKGQLISKCHFDNLKFSKKKHGKFDKFLPKNLKSGEIISTL